MITALAGLIEIQLVVPGQYTILDMGELDREYSPIRVTQDERIDRKNEPLMTMTKEIVELVIEHVTGKTK